MPHEPRPPFYEDPVYHHLSRLHQEADEKDAGELDRLMQQLIDGSLPDDRYDELVVEAREAKKERKAERKKRQPARRHVRRDDGPGQDTASLKRRIHNPQTSRDNMIKAIEALPPAERRATLDNLPPGLRRKLGNYLE